MTRRHRAGRGLGYRRLSGCASHQAQARSSHPIYLQLRALLCLSAAAFILFAAKAAKAEYLFTPSLSYETEKVTDRVGLSVDNTRTNLTLDARLGYLFPETGFYVGGLYKTEIGSFTGGDRKGFAFGASIGFAQSYFQAIATYLLGAQRNVNLSGSETKLTSGSGYQIDFAYAPEISANVGFGPQLTYRVLKYTRSSVGSGPETGNSYETSSFTPSLVLWFIF